jgi:subtilisin family serine protease
MKYEKLSAGMFTVLRDYEEEGRAGLAKLSGLLGLAGVESATKPPSVVVFLRCDPEASLSDLAARNIRINRPRGRIRTAMVPLERIEDLSEDSRIFQITPSRYLRLLMDVAPGRVHVPQFRTGNNLDGTGVVIGVIDTGIDPNHAAFQGRIHRIWDQVIPGPGVPEGGFGLELSGAALTASRDTDGHGTHVAGIAAGNHPSFGGVAPGATLVVVKSSLQNAHIASGVEYVFRVAQDLGLPAVVNLSLGGHFDAHDGSDDLSESIDQAVGPGRIVCCAAGNEGDDNLHARVNLRGRQSRSVRFQITAASGRFPLLNAWYSGADVIEVAVRTPQGFQTPFQRPILGANPQLRHVLPGAIVTVVTPGPDPANGDHNILVELRGPGGANPPAGAWRIIFRGVTVSSGRVDIWSLDSEGGSNVPFLTQVEDAVKIGSPGSAASAITVASFTTKNQWTDLTGALRQVGLAVNDISSFSSEGPLRNATLKPEVAAPGAMITAALSADSSVNPAFVDAPTFRVNAGTSMATPFIAGIVALMLQRDRNLDPAAVKAAFQANSAIPGRPPGTHDRKWGFGLLDAQNL